MLNFALSSIPKGGKTAPFVYPAFKVEYYFNRGLQRLYTGSCIFLQKTIKEAKK